MVSVTSICDLESEMKSNTYESIQYLFEPRSIAVIGASRDEAKIGHTIVKNIISGGYQGKVYPVNPGGGEVLNLHSYKSIREIEEPVDVASIAIPAKFVRDAVADCAEKGVKHVQIITSGFSEVVSSLAIG